MNNPGRKYRIFLIFWALSALYICVGSLVHFHQYKIYGKKLVAEVVISKREHEISVKNADAGSEFQTGSPALVAGETNKPVISVTILVANGSGIPPAKTCCLANSGLRAPPLA
jgi:hypothetical protein